MKKPREILSISRVITNSSTEVFILDYDDILKELVEKYNLKDDYSFYQYNSLEEIREILIKGIPSFQKSFKERTKDDEKNIRNLEKLCDFSYRLGIFPEGIISDSDQPTCNFEKDYLPEVYYNNIWWILRKIGKSDEEIIDFILPGFKNFLNKAIYVFEDYYITDIAEILYKHGYESSHY